MNPLLSLQGRITSRATPESDPEQLERLSITSVGDHVHLDFYGNPSGESYAELMRTIPEPEVAQSLTSLQLSGPDVEANGTRNWDLSPMAGARVDYPQLRCLVIEQNRPTDHNRSIVARAYEEEGVLANILARSPRLERLVTPSAPNADFFRVPSPALHYLDVDAGYDHQGFIANLAQSTCFPGLRYLAFGEYHETYMEDFAQRVTPFADYRELFASPAFAVVKRFVWRNSVGTPAEMAELAALLPACRVQVVRWSVERLG